MRKLKNPWFIWICIVLSILIVLFLLKIPQDMFTWFTYNSTIYEQIEHEAVATKDPKKCEKLPVASGDSSPRDNCYFKSTVKIGDPSFRTLPSANCNSKKRSNNLWYGQLLHY
jgi:hypothetical protein